MQLKVSEIEVGGLCNEGEMKSEIAVREEALTPILIVYFILNKVPLCD